MSTTAVPHRAPLSTGLRIAGAAGATKAVPQRGSAAAHQQWTQGVALARQGKALPAAGHFERACKLSPSVPLYWMNLASALRKLARYDAAISAAERAFALDNTDETACHLLTELLRLNNREAEALQALQQLHTATPRSPRHWLLQGSLLMTLGEWQPAALAFLQVLSLIHI